jgi:hypothetical protein
MRKSKKFITLAPRVNFTKTICTGVKQNADLYYSNWDFWQLTDVLLTVLCQIWFLPITKNVSHEDEIKLVKSKKIFIETDS